jgi:hypothetical protein
MKQVSGHVLAIVVGIGIGYFVGREHLKYEMRSAFESAAEGFQESISSAFGSNDTRGGQNISAASESRAEEERLQERLQTEEDVAEATYIAGYLRLYDVSAKHTDSLLDGRVPGILFKVQNTGDKSLDRVEVTVFFKDADGRTIAEEDFLPVLVSEYSFSGDNQPLKAGYIWQMEEGKFYAAKQVPSEWKEGSFEAVITDIEFSE